MLLNVLYNFKVLIHSYKNSKLAERQNTRDFTHVEYKETKNRVRQKTNANNLIVKLRLPEGEGPAGQQRGRWPSEL